MKSSGLLSNTVRRLSQSGCGSNGCASVTYLERLTFSVTAECQNCSTCYLLQTAAPAA